MSKRSVFFFVFLCLWLCMPGSGPSRTAQVQNVKAQPNVNPSGLKVDFGSIPLYFTANRGQVDGRALFYAKASRYTLWLTEEGLVFDSFKSDAEPAASGRALSLPNEKFESRKYQRDVSRLVFLNASKHPVIVPVDETALKVNYFIGNDPAKWHTAVPTSASVLYKNIYNRIDLKVYGSESRIEYDWIVRSGGDPRDIRFKYENVKGTRVDKEGNLLIETGVGELVHKKPAAYQETGRKSPAEGQLGNGSHATVKSAFKRVGENAYGFEVGVYEARLELIIDPVVLAYSTYLGGSGTDQGYGIAADNSGNVYVSGTTYYSANFPILNQYQMPQGSGDVFVTKIDTTKSGGASLVYSTFLGGSGADINSGISVDGSGNAYIAGLTNSTNFPVLNQYQTFQAVYDVFVTKLDTTKSGTASLVYSTYLGGDDSDESRGRIAQDGSGNVYLAGVTWSTNFPTINQFQTDPADGNAHAFVTKIDTTKSGSASLVYSTCLRGNNSDYGRGIALDGIGNAYVTGWTYSTDFPTLNQFQTDPGDGKGDVFVTKIDTTKSGSASLIYSTYLGGSDHDNGQGIAVDGNGNAFVTGYTRSADFPMMSPYQTSLAGGTSDAFVTKIDTTKSGSASLIYSTYLGGSNNDYGYGIALDGIGNAYVTGYTASTNFPVLNEYQTFQAGLDVFVTRLDTTKTGTASLVYSTYLGGNSDDTSPAIAVDNSGNTYVTGYTNSINFPVVNQYQTDQPMPDAFITKISASAEIVVTKTSDNLTPKVGEEFNFTVTATDNGPLAATGLKVTDKLPTGLGFVSATPSQGSYDSGTGVWNIGSLAKDAVATLTLRASANDPGEITNTASVSARNESDTEESNDSASANVTVLTPCTIETSPSGLSIAVDGNATTAPKTFDWEPGSSHTIGVTSPQTGETGTQYVYSSWSDAGAQSHAITVPSAVTTYSASFTTQYTLTTLANPPAGGTVSPAGTNYYTKDQNVQVQAVSKPLYVFTGWSGNLIGTTNPATITVSGPMSITANFISGKTLNAAVLSEPSNGAAGQPVPLTLKWQDTNSSPQELNYQLRIKPVGGTYKFYTLAAGSISYVASSLVAGRVYHWNVQALGTGTTTKNSTWANGGVDYNFTVAPAVTLNMPTLVAPANGATAQPTTVTLQWLDTNSSPQEVSYKIRIKPSGGTYSNYTVGANVVSFLKSGLAKGKTYSWSVQAVGNSTSTKDSAFPADRKFKTAQ